MRLIEDSKDLLIKSLENAEDERQLELKLSIPLSAIPSKV